MSEKYIWIQSIVKRTKTNLSDLTVLNRDKDLIHNIWGETSGQTIKPHEGLMEQ